MCGFPSSHRITSLHAIKLEKTSRRKAASWRLSVTRDSDTMSPEPSRSDEDESQDEGSLAESEPSDQCEDDRCRGPTPPVWHCVDCDSSYCRWVDLEVVYMAWRLTLQI